MTKAASSDLLNEFLIHVEAGTICAADNQFHDDGTDTIRQLYRAFDDILNGENPDKALRITRSSGVEHEPHTLPLALFIHRHKYEEKENWAVVELLSTEWLATRDLPPLTLSGLKQLYRRNKADVEMALERRALRAADRLTRK